MRQGVSFTKNGRDYHAEVYYDQDGIIDCTECYRIDYDGEYHTVDVDWRKFRFEIEEGLFPVTKGECYWDELQATYR